MLAFPPIDRHGVLIAPTTESDIAELDAACDDEALFEFFPVGVRSTRPARGSVLAGLGDRLRLPLTVRRAPDRAVVGSTSLYEVSEDTKHVTVGYTWFSRAVHRTGINQRCKLAVLEWLFEDWGAHRVTLYVDDQNAPSRAAVLAIGATEEGVLREHARRRDGTYRDTVVYSILDREWTDCKMALLDRIAARDAPPSPAMNGPRRLDREGGPAGTQSTTGTVND